MHESTRAPFKSIQSHEKQACYEVVDDAMAEILRGKTVAQRLAIADGMWHFAQDMIRANIKAGHPNWSTEEVEQATARRMSHGAV